MWKCESSGLLDPTKQYRKPEWSIFEFFPRQLKHYSWFCFVNFILDLVQSLYKKCLLTLSLSEKPFRYILPKSFPVDLEPWDTFLHLAQIQQTHTHKRNTRATLTDTCRKSSFGHTHFTWNWVWSAISARGEYWQLLLFIAYSSYYIFSRPP